MKLITSSSRKIWSKFPAGLQSVVGIMTLLTISMLTISFAAVMTTKVRSSDLVQSITMAKNSVQLNNYDRAYCSSKERFVQVVDIREARGVACWSGTGLIYEGVDKLTGDTIRLEAIMRGNEVVVASNGGTIYEMTPNGLFIKENGETKASYWTENVEYRSEDLQEFPGDLQIEGHNISYPNCDGKLIVLQTILDDVDIKIKVQNALSQDVGTSYLRSDLSCDNFNMPSRENSNFEYMYAVYKSFPYSDNKQVELCKEIKEEPPISPEIPSLIVDRLQDGVLSSSNLCDNAS